MTGKPAAMIALSMLLTSAAQAQDTTKPHLITNPDWLKKPTAESMLSVWPTEARKRGIGGKAVIRCKVSLQGVLVNCVVVSETPEGSGFGQAAIAMTPQLLLTPQKVDGVPVEGGEVQIPLNFESFDGGTQGTNVSLTIRRWSAAPTYAQVAAAYPPKARAKGLGGKAVLDCKLAVGGKLERCVEIVANPFGLSIGQYAKTLTRYFVGPEAVGGKSTKGMTTQIIVVFAPEMLTSANPTIGKPEWVSLPNLEQLSAAMPSYASLTGPARILLNCAVVADGKVEDCKVVSEDPPGKGLGVKALELTKYFQLTVWSQEGLPTVGGRINIPVRYEFGTSIAKP